MSVDRAEQGREQCRGVAKAKVEVVGCCRRRDGVQLFEGEAVRLPATRATIQRHDANVPPAKLRRSTLKKFKPFAVWGGEWGGGEQQVSLTSRDLTALLTKNPDISSSLPVCHLQIPTNSYRPLSCCLISGQQV